MEEEIGVAKRTKQGIAERAISIIRLVLVAFNSLVYLWFMQPSAHHHLALGIIVVANVYAALTAIKEVHSMLPGAIAGIWTTFTDAALIVLWLFATGQGHSPFWPIWAVSLVAISFRYGPKAAILATVTYGVLSVGLSIIWLPSPMPLSMLVNHGYLIFIGILGTFVASTSLGAMAREELIGRVQGELEAVTEAVPALILGVQQDGTIRFSNQGHIGNVVAIFASQDQAQIQDALRSKEEPVRIATVRLNSQPRRVHEVVVTPIEDGAILLVTDCTEQREQEARSREAQKRELELQQLQEEGQKQQRFINAVAHELNTPLTPLKLQVRVLERAPDEERRKRSLLVLGRNLDRLALLVQDLLEVSRLQRGAITLNRKRVDMGALVDEAVYTFQELEAGKVQLECELSGDLHLEADRDRMTQVLYNLLSNAIKFSPQDGTVKVRAWAEEGFRLTVSDEGPGFSSTEMTQLFQPFSQIRPSPDPENPGTGLGLYICRGIVEAHHGNIGVDSNGHGAGSTFWVHIPN